MKLLSKLKKDRLKYEFLPAAEEIIETPPSPFGYSVVWMITALLLIALAWSYFGKLDIIASATGKITPEGSIKTIQPATPGVITEIKTSEGQSVKKGQLLIQLDSSVAKSEVATAEQALSIAKLERDILTKTIAKEDVTTAINAASIPDSTKQHLISLAESKVSASEIQRQLLSVGITNAQKQVDSQRQSKQTIQDNLQKLQLREQELNRDLEKATVLTASSIKNELRSVQQQISSLETSLTTQDQQIAQAELGVNEASEKLNSYNAEHASSTYSDIVDQDKRIVELENAFTKAKQAVEQLAIKAPVDGKILSLATKTIGGVVNGAQPIVEIVPENTALIVEASVQNKDVGFIQIGQPTTVKVDTYSFHRYGYLHGKVKSISPDAINDEKQGLIYKIKVEIDTTKTSRDTTLKIEPGMSVTTEITTGKRRIIEFFLDPLMTYTDASLEVR